MSVDFDGDEPYAVEDLLIYLYTLEYPNRKSRRFEVPAVQEKAPKPAMPEGKGTDLLIGTLPMTVSQC